MTHASDGGLLSWGDALFLYLEREGMPLNVAGVSIFEGTIPVEACARFVESKLPLIPRYQQRVVTPPFNLGLPRWQYDAQFDIRNHVHQRMLNHGTEEECKEVAADILSTTLDRRRPLWDLTLLRGLKGNRTGLVARVHHCLADGVAGVGLMNVIMDTSPTPPEMPKQSERAEPPRPVPAASILLDSLVSSYFSAVQGLLSMHSEMISVAQQVMADEGLKAGLAHFLPEVTKAAERLPFNKVCRGPQNVAWGDVSMNDIKSMRDAIGATMNDVVLALITMTYEKYARAHDMQVTGKSLRLVVPVNVRGNGSVSELGNRISFVPVDIPFGIANPLKLIETIHMRTEMLKATRAAQIVGFLGGLIMAVPSAMQAVAGPVASRMPIPVCNSICTNVPGPQVPLYLMGHKMTRWYPYVPIGGEMGVNVAILTYNGTAYFGFSGDVHAAPDLRRLEEFLSSSIDEMRKAAGARKKSAAGKNGKKADAKIPPEVPSVQVAQAKAAQAKKAARIVLPDQVLAFIRDLEQRKAEEPEVPLAMAAKIGA